MSVLAIPSWTLSRERLFDPILRRDAIGARTRRIALLLVAMTLMGVFDLLYTLTYIRTSGMLEANPLARQMIDIGGARQLILFKALTILLSVAAIIFIRRSPKAELSAWLCTAMMLTLTVHWLNYNREVSEFTRDMAVLAMSGGEFEPMWVKLDE